MTNTRTTARATPDISNDGYLKIEGAQTLRRYEELTRAKSNAPCKEFGIFFAFNKEQFREGYNELVRNGKLKEGDKVVRLTAGGFAIKGGAEKLTDYLNNIDLKIKAECNPQEVYWYEYNNHECHIAYDGDREAIMEVIAIFGRETAEKIKRMRAFESIEEISGGNTYKEDKQ